MTSEPSENWGREKHCLSKVSAAWGIPMKDKKNGRKEPQKMFPNPRRDIEKQGNVRKRGCEQEAVETLVQAKEPRSFQGTV